MGVESVILQKLYMLIKFLHIILRTQFLTPPVCDINSRMYNSERKSKTKRSRKNQWVKRENNKRVSSSVAESRFYDLTNPLKHTRRS